VRAHVFPIVSAAPGLRGYSTLLDGRDVGRPVSASL
jgi:hypothetical protein